MLRPEDVEVIRRSTVAGPLPVDVTQRLIETCVELLAERRQIEEILAALPESFGEVRSALNKLAKIVRGDVAPRAIGDGGG